MTIKLIFVSHAHVLAVFGCTRKPWCEIYTTKISLRRWSITRMQITEGASPSVKPNKIEGEKKIPRKNIAELIKEISRTSCRVSSSRFASFSSRLLERSAAGRQRFSLARGKINRETPSQAVRTHLAIWQTCFLCFHSLFSGFQVLNPNFFFATEF